MIIKCIQRMSANIELANFVSLYYFMDETESLALIMKECMSWLNLDNN